MHGNILFNQNNTPIYVKKLKEKRSKKDKKEPKEAKYIYRTKEKVYLCILCTHNTYRLLLGCNQLKGIIKKGFVTPKSVSYICLSTSRKLPVKCPQVVVTQEYNKYVWPNTRQHNLFCKECGLQHEKVRNGSFTP